MKQALVSLMRAVVGARSAAGGRQQVALPELTATELRSVSGGANEACGPKGTWS